MALTHARLTEILATTGEGLCAISQPVKVPMFWKAADPDPGDEQEGRLIIYKNELLNLEPDGWGTEVYLIDFATCVGPDHKVGVDEDSIWAGVNDQAELLPFLARFGVTLATLEEFDATKHALSDEELEVFWNQ